MDLNLFHNTYSLYKDGNVSDEKWVEYYEILFTEISKIKPEDLIIEHLVWMKKCEKFFASIENYEKASILKQVQVAAQMVFNARENLEEIKRKYKG